MLWFLGTLWYLSGSEMCAGRTVGLVCTRTTNECTREEVMAEVPWRGGRGFEVGTDDDDEGGDEVGGWEDVKTVDVSSGCMTANHHDRGGCE